MGSKSLVWNFFSKDTLKENAVCTICSSVLVCRGGSTTSLGRHLTFKHQINLKSISEETSSERDQSEKSLKKFSPTLVTEEDEGHLTCPNFDGKKFIEEKCIPKLTAENINTNRVCENNLQESYDGIEKEDFFPGKRPSSRLSPVDTLQSKKTLFSTKFKRNYCKKTDITSKDLLIIGKKLNLILEKIGKVEDDDELFFRSLLPAMKKLNLLQRFSLRGKIIEWILELITQPDCGFDSQPSSSHLYNHTQPSKTSVEDIPNINNKVSNHSNKRNEVKVFESDPLEMKCEETSSDDTDDENMEF